MKRSINPASKERRPAGCDGFTLLEVMVAMAILAVSIIPMLLLRENSYHRAMETKRMRVLRELAQRELDTIALNVRYGDGSGQFEDWSDIRYEYKVTLYDFGAGMGTGEDESGFDSFSGSSSPNDSVFADENQDSYGPMVMRHVELTLYYTAPDESGEEMEEKYVVETYLPLLLTEDQYQRSQEKGQASQ